jgi:phage tail protein X
VDGGKFILAGGLMVAGIGGAMSFRHDGPPVAALPARSGETMVRRVVEPIETARPLAPPTNFDVAARLTGRVEPHALAGREASPRPRVAGEYALTSAEGPAPSAGPYDDRTPRYNRALPTATDWPEVGGFVAEAVAADGTPPNLAAENPFRTQNAALTTFGGGVLPAAERSHTVRDGDTLSTLAERYYGDAGRYREILEANREVLSAADLLPIGARLRIPAVAAAAPTPPPAARIVPRLEFHGLGGR